MSVFANLQQSNKPVVVVDDTFNDDDTNDNDGSAQTTTSDGRRLRLDVAATNRFIQHGLASCEVLSLRQWRQQRNAQSATATTMSTTTTTSALRRSTRTAAPIKNQARPKRSSDQVDATTEESKPLLRRSLRLAIKRQSIKNTTTVEVFRPIVSAPIIAFASKRQKTAVEIRQAATQRRTAHLMKKRLSSAARSKTTTTTAATTTTTTVTTTTTTTGTTNNIFAMMTAVKRTN